MYSLCVLIFIIWGDIERKLEIDTPSNLRASSYVKDNISYRICPLLKKAGYDVFL